MSLLPGSKKRCSINDGCHRLSQACHLIANYLAVFFKYGTIGNSVGIDASTLCQLTCVDCNFAKGEMGVNSRGYLRSNDFRKFVDAHPEFRHIELSNDGEIFLNPELKEIMRYAHEKGIDLTALNGVNFNTVSDEMLEDLVRYRFNAMTVSIDGASSQTYKIYRRRGDFDAVIANIKKLNQYKEKYHSLRPQLIWQFIVFGHNEHELPVARKMAKEFGMGFWTKFGWNSAYSPVRDREFVTRELGAASRDEYEEKTGKAYMRMCRQLWVQPQINWDGRLFGCCVNIWGDYGNVFESGLKRCLKGEKYRYAKKMLLGKAKERPDIPCVHCFAYKEMRSGRCPLKIFEGINLFERLTHVLDKNYV